LTRARNATLQSIYQSDYVRKATADITLAMEDVSRAIELIQQRTELAALPSGDTTRLRASRYGAAGSVSRFATRQASPGPPALGVSLNNLNMALERLSLSPGGDLNGMRPTLVSGITAAARSVIDAMVKANEERR
jgi:hypothetical protein